MITVMGLGERDDAVDRLMCQICEEKPKDVSLDPCGNKAVQIDINLDLVWKALGFVPTY